MDSNSIEEHIEHLLVVFVAIGEAGMKLKINNCEGS